MGEWMSWNWFSGAAGPWKSVSQVWVNAPVRSRRPAQ
jgi:hypothetical protein